MTTSSHAEAPDAIQPYMAGEAAAEKFITDLSTLVPVGDDLYRVIDDHTHRLSFEDHRFLSGFLRTIQKRLEAVS